MDHIDEVLGKFEEEVSELADRIISTYRSESGIELSREIVRLSVRARLAAIEAFINLYRIGGLQAVYRAGFIYSGTESQYNVVLIDSDHQKAICIFEVTETSEGSFLYPSGVSVTCKVKLINDGIITIKFIETKDNIVPLE